MIAELENQLLFQPSTRERAAGIPILRDNPSMRLPPAPVFVGINTRPVYAQVAMTGTVFRHSITHYV